jgi:hypothetical protein
MKARYLIDEALFLNLLSYPVVAILRGCHAFAEKRAVAPADGPRRDLGHPGDGLPRRPADEFAASLPAGVRAVWDQDKAQGESTPTRERICINGLCSGRVRR